MAENQPAATKPALMNIGIGRLLGMIGGILALLGALLPWATVTGGARPSPETFLGIDSGLFGVLLSQLGVFGIIMMIDGKRTTVLVGLVIGIFAILLPAITMNFMTSVPPYGQEVGIAIETGIGLYICLTGGLLLLVGAIIAFIEIRKPGKAQTQLLKPSSKGKPMEVYLLFCFTLAAAALLLANPWTIGQLDVVGAVLFIFGILLAVTAFYVYKVEYWSWGTILIVLLIALLFAVPSGQFVLIGFFDILAFILYYTRLTYGVGLWKIEQAIEEQERKEREVVRTANPEGFHCPRCKSNEIYICEDNSTYCKSCNVGFVNIENATAKPRSSMQGT